MFKFDIKEWIPQFIYNDRNGYALAKAIETGMQVMNNAISDGIKCMSDYDSMPEWRLDEMAWETNCLYDYDANIEIKRLWIKKALPLYRLYGTPSAIEQYVGSYFDAVELQEFWEYYGEPYHFRVTVEGSWTPERETWLKKAISYAKNVRSVLDTIRTGHSCLLGIQAEGEILSHFCYGQTNEHKYAGLFPHEVFAGALDDTGKTAVRAEGKPFSYSPIRVGTLPDPNMIGAVSGGSFGIQGNGKEQKIEYLSASERVYTGTEPNVNTESELDESGKTGICADITERQYTYPETQMGQFPEITPGDSIIGKSEKNSIHAANADDTYIEIPYILCGSDEIF